ncbi:MULTISPECIES: hypothetical protein [Listeria]|uniref:hypothetical protein n=1 Tax=Listeria TaxID=1637 RepID=UPI000B593E4E|nr:MULTISPECIES: hypothetical protein [Listeria]
MKLGLVVIDKKGDFLLKESIPVKQPGSMGLDILENINYYVEDYESQSIRFYCREIEVMGSVG